MTAATSFPRRLTLQTRLMLTVIGIVSAILIVIAVAMSTLLGSLLQENLDARLQSAAQTAAREIGMPRLPATDTSAYEVLAAGRQQEGFLLVVASPSSTSGAYVAEDGAVVEMSPDEVDELTTTIQTRGFSTVEVEGLGEYRVVPFTAGASVAIAGLPTSEVRSTLAEVLVTIGLVTAGGLLILGAATAIVIRVGLRPLRAVAETATRVAAVPMDQGHVSITERVPAAEVDDRTEIGRVGAALNTLIDHVDASLDARQHNEERMRRFVADASHELRTPLASIRGYSELSLRALAQSPETAGETTSASLERIQAQSLRMTTLVEDLLLLARLDEGQELVYSRVDLTRLVVEAVGDARPAGPDHSWALDVDEEPVAVTGDSTRLHQVIANLLTNARTHTPAGTTVTVALRPSGGTAEVTVHDDGPGIDPDVIDEIFERFSRGDRSRARKTGGTGLGLSIAKAIVGAHDGTLTVSSTPGDTTFVIRLPIRTDEAGDDQ